jgi:hypothetical protein
MEEKVSSGIIHDDLLFQTIDKPPASWADIVEESAKEKRIKKKESKKRKRQDKQNTKKGRELFIGNTVFEDIDSLHAKVKS